MMLPKDKWNEGKIKLLDPENNSSNTKNNKSPEFIAPANLTAILKKPVEYDWRYETNGKKDEDPWSVYDEKWVGKEIRHFPWSKELIEETSEKLLKPNGYHIPTKDEWVSICNNLKAKLAEEQEVTVEEIDDEDLSTALTERLRLVRGGDVYSSQQYSAGYFGYYWSSTVYSSNCAYILGFRSDDVDPEYGSDRLRGHSVRCVAR